MEIRRRILILVTTPLLSVIPLLAAPATQPAPPPEATSDLADLWRDRDAYFLKLDGRMPQTPGIAPAGTREIAIRLDSATRGREFPGRYTVIEVELHPFASELLTVGFTKGPAVQGTLPANVWSKVRIPVPTDRGDLLIRSPNGLAAKLEFRRVRLIDDRWIVIDQSAAGGWKVERAAGAWMLTPPGKSTLTLPPSTAGWKVLEANPIRVRIASGTDYATLYAAGRVASSVPALPSVENDARIKVTIGEDFGRIDRNTDGDLDGDGYNESRGATVLRLAERRVSFTVAPAATTTRAPALELHGLPPGDISAVLEGKVLKRVERLLDNSVLLELPGDLRSEARLEVSVEPAGSP